MTATFQRARSDEQRAERRQAILGTAEAMLAEMPVAQLTLNELSRQVGLAKSNVLRYFETREAVLLALLNEELDAWAASIESSRIPRGGLPRRIDALAHRLTASLAERPMLCDLISAQASVLERNVSTEVVLEHKRGTGEVATRLQAFIRAALPELDDAGAYTVVATTLLMCSAAWPQGHPSEAVLAAYAQDADVRSHQMDFDAWMQRTVALCIRGLLSEG